MNLAISLARSGFGSSIVPMSSNRARLVHLGGFLVALSGAIACGSQDDFQGATTGVDGSAVDVDAGLSSPTTVTREAGAPADAGAALDASVSEAAASDAPAMNTQKPHFFGINGHPDYTFGAQEWVDACRQIGAKSIRLDTWAFDATKVAHIASLATSIAAIDSSILIFPSITFSFDDAIDEEANYTATLDKSKTLVAQLGAAGISDFECGNELLTDPRVFPTGGAPGTSAADFTGSGAAWASLRGAIRGCIDAVHAVNPAYRAGVNFTIAQTAGSDMMWTGTEPDGSTGHPTVKWDITTWHSYSPYGNPFHMGAAAFNLIDYIANAYHRPIMITEWNSGTNCDAQGTSWTTDIITDMFANRNQYDIESIHFYQLGGDSVNFGLLSCPDKTAVYTNFTAGHPSP